MIKAYSLLMLALIQFHTDRILAAEQDCSFRYANNLLNFMEDGARIEKHLATQDIKNFCHVTTKNQAQKDIAKGTNLTSDDEIKEKAAKESQFQSPWYLGYYPSTETRERIFDTNLQSPFEHTKSLDSTEAFLKSNQNSSEIEKPVDLRSGQFSSNAQTEVKDVIKKGGPGIAEKVAFCFELVFSTDCPGALDSVIQQSLPNDYEITQIHLYKEILTNKQYDEGLRIASLKVIDRFKNRKTTPVKDASLFEDIENSFISAGASKKDAKAMTWKTMGLLATGGPNTSRRLFGISPPDSAPTKKTSLAILSTLPYALDTEGFSIGQVYSYPKSIRTTCDSGKPYHFWLSAYLAWEQAQKGFSAKASAAAAFLANKGYQMFSRTSTRYPTKPLEEDFMGVYSNSIRMDLAYASAGAIYGANAGKENGETELNVDDGLKNIINEGERQPKLTREEARSLADSPISFARQWSSVMSPNSGFNLFKAKLK